MIRPAPYPDGAAHLADHLDRVALALERYIARHGHRLVQASGRLNDLYVSLGEVKSVMARRASAEPPAAPAGFLAEPGLPTVGASEVALARADQAIAERVVATLRAERPPFLPLEALRADFRLDPIELELLVYAIAPLVSVDLARLYTFAWADFAVKRPTVGFLAELAGAHGPVAALARYFRPDGALVRRRLVVLSDTEAWGAPTPLIHRAVTVPDSVVALVAEQLGAMPSALALACTYQAPAAAEPLGALTLPEALRRELVHTLRAARPNEATAPRLVLEGVRGSGRRTMLAAALAELGWGLVTIDLELLVKDDAAFDEALQAACREALLRHAVPLLRGDAVLDDAALVERFLHRIAAVVAAHEGLVAFTAPGAVPRLHDLLERTVSLALVRPSSRERLVLWHSALTRAGARPADDVVKLLSDRFDLPPGRIFRAARDAVMRAGVVADAPAGGAGHELTPADVHRAVKERLDHALTAYAEAITTPLDWKDAILPEDVMQTLREILAHAKHRARVYESWGFRKRMAYGTGLSCLFSGPPGTGKTMMAAVLAKTLGQDLYRVDLSKISSKWIGETEKNLARIFEEAEAARAILLFDEADSLFSKRTSVQSSNDRFANMEVNYLLQRMESYDGTTILTTNFAESLDDAFKRRIKFRVRFPLPGPDERALLWKTSIPPEVRCAPGLDFAELGLQFELSGGNVKNAVLRAAFAAADADGVLTQQQLRDAARSESREMGILVRA